LRQRFRAGLGDRAIAIVAALLLELLLVWVLLSLGLGRPEEQPQDLAVTTFDVREDAAPQSQDAPEPQSEAQPLDSREEVTETEPRPQLPQPEPLRPLPVIPRTAPVAPAIVPPAPAEPDQPPKPKRPRAVIRGNGSYGPSDNRALARAGDTPVVGTAPDGEPLYAARWFREPTHEQMAGYLSTAAPPSWALIACKTAPDWRVEDCVGIDQYPAGSNIQQAVLAAAWQFEVRPPRRGSQSLIGSWVRIRIEYTRGGVSRSGG
jgi:protein TonB